MGQNQAPHCGKIPLILARRPCVRAMQTVMRDPTRAKARPRNSPGGHAAGIWIALLALAVASWGEVPADSGDLAPLIEEGRQEVPADSQEVGGDETQEVDSEDTKEPEKGKKDQGRQATPGAPSKSGYDEIPMAGGPTSVESDLQSNDEFKNPVFGFLQWAVAPLYDFKDRVNGTWGIAFGVDYNFLNQYASFSTTEKQATSGALRFYGTWNLFHSKEKVDGGVVFRVENRHKIGGGVVPRDLGFDAGSALSTASFKDFAWGLTSLYWKQFFAKRRFAFVFGQMDPGDFMDAYPLLSAWTAFMSDAFFNNPAEALPQQGVGFVTRLFLNDHYYISGGIHDALADADGFNVAQLLDGEDLFYWAEVGWSPTAKAVPGDSIHLTYWQQDELDEKDTEKSRGFAFSVAPQLHSRYLPFLRIGYSEGDAAIMRWIYAIGLGMEMRESDLLGIATSYGAPVEANTDAQLTTELFYRIQMTEHLQVTPAVQMTRNPSFNPLKKNIWVGSVLRMRLAF